MCSDVYANIGQLLNLGIDKKSDETKQSEIWIETGHKTSDLFKDKLPRKADTDTITRCGRLVVPILNEIFDTLKRHLVEMQFFSLAIKLD